MSSHTDQEQIPLIDLTTSDDETPTMPPTAWPYRCLPLSIKSSSTSKPSTSSSTQDSPSPTSPSSSSSLSRPASTDSWMSDRPADNKQLATTPFFLSKDLDFFCRVCRHHHPMENCLVTFFTEGRRRVMPPPTRFCETYKEKGSKTTYEVSSKEKIDNWKTRKANIFQSTTVNSISKTSLTIKRFEKKSYINPWSIAPWDNDEYLSATIHHVKFNNTNRPALDMVTSTYISREKTFH